MQVRTCCIFLLLSLAAIADDRLLTAPLNDPAQRHKPYVLLIGIDGFRADYPDKYNASALRAIRDRGSYATRLLPSFPSTTFPNFFTLVTGQRPQEHGIVSMEFLDPESGETFSYRTKAAEAKWYEAATPLWVLAEQNGLRTASYFWVGSEAPIKGQRPSAWFTYDANVTGETKVAKVLEWLRLPEERRPHLVTLYFAEIDTAAHRHGPDSQQVQQAIHEVDAALAKLLGGLEAIQPAVNVVVVSDHGLASVDRIVDITDHADWSGATVISLGSMVMVYSQDKAKLDAIERSLRARRSTEYAVYRRGQLPKHLHYRDNPRSGDLVILSTGKHAIGVRKTPTLRAPQPGGHGFDPMRVREMAGMLCAAGPNVRSGATLGEVDNIEVFGFLAKILGLPLPAGANSGKSLVKRWYREAPATSPKMP